MTYMIICSDDIAIFHKGRDHVEVSAGVLTEAVDQLNDALWSAGRDVDPAIDLVAFIEGQKLHFM
jgi:hypothetical protein